MVHLVALALAHGFAFRVGENGTIFLAVAFRGTLVHALDLKVGVDRLDHGDADQHEHHERNHNQVASGRHVGN